MAYVIYATPRYAARNRVLKTRVNHGAGGEFENKISNNAKTELRI
jgi:hypothetical protein